MRARIFAVFAALVTAMLAIAPAKAQDLYAVSVTNYAKIPPKATYVTDMNDNTELTSTAEGALRTALTGRGLTYDVDGTIGFKIGTQRETGSPNSDAAFDSSNTTLHLPFNSGDVKGSPRIGHIYRITLNIYDRASGAVLSRGDVTDHQFDADPVGVTPMMVEELLDKVAF